MSRSLSPRATAAAPRWPGRLRSLAFGGDYNPEQWPEDVWAEDVRLMREAGVTMVTVGVFSWALLEPAEGEYDFGWLDRVLELLHDAGILVDLATPTASPPAVVLARLPRVAAGHRRGRHARHRRRETFCPSSADYRRGRLRIASALADRYADHPALALWHVHNEYGAHVGPCYCTASRRRSAAGCASATGRSTRSTTRGARASGARATATGRRSPRRGARRCRSTPRSSSTSGASPRPSTSSATGASATSCASCRRTSR